MRRRFGVQRQTGELAHFVGEDGGELPVTRAFEVNRLPTAGSDTMLENQRTNTGSLPPWRSRCGPQSRRLDPVKLVVLRREHFGQAPCTGRTRCPGTGNSLSSSTISRCRSSPVRRSGLGAGVHDPLDAQDARRLEDVGIPSRPIFMLSQGMGSLEEDHGPVHQPGRTLLSLAATSSCCRSEMSPRMYLNLSAYGWMRFMNSASGGAGSKVTTSFALRVGQQCQGALLAERGRCLRRPGLS